MTRRQFSPGRIRAALTTLLLLYNSTVVLSAFCYLPNGEVEPLEYQPCNQVHDTISMCCATNRTNPSGGPGTAGYAADLCLSNGLCLNQWEIEGEEAFTYWRESCSVSSWETPCLRDLCREQEDENGHAPMTPCDGTAESETWCCGYTTDCCGTDDEINIASLLDTTSSVSSSSTPTPTPSRSQDSAVDQPTQTPETPPPPPSLSTGAKAGIGVGAGAGGVLVIGVLVLLFLRRRRQQRQQRERQQKALQPLDVSVGFATKEGESPAQLEANDFHELLGDGRPHEMPAPK